MNSELQIGHDMGKRIKYYIQGQNFSGSTETACLNSSEISNEFLLQQ